jgi:hypothetical protein
MPHFHEFLTQAHQLLETARTLDARSKSGGVEFVNTELDLSRTFAEGALALFSGGLVSQAERFGGKKGLSDWPKLPTEIRSRRRAARTD